jgi:coenzyme F420-reducing hydrogenase alpha subunit
MKDKLIKVDYLARVEGEGALYIKVKNGYVVDVKLRIFEPPRFFEAFLRGRSFMEVPDITARICGICPIAYQMSSVHAIESIFGVKVSGPIRELRRLIYCGEWIESHALHVFMLHAPDFLGYEDIIQMAKDYPDLVKNIVLDAKMVPPTSQNLKMMESDLWKFASVYLNLPDDELTWKCEQAVRNYDPCISCATHFLKVHIERE